MWWVEEVHGWGGSERFIRLDPGEECETDVRVESSDALRIWGLWIVVGREGPGRSLEVCFSVADSDQTSPGSWGTACGTWARPSGLGRVCGWGEPETQWGGP